MKTLFVLIHLFAFGSIALGEAPCRGFQCHGPKGDVCCTYPNSVCCPSGAKCCPIFYGCDAQDKCIYFGPGKR
ncbi:hypothetical protein L596_016262 [Steinernema carpocapsae]|uniref:Granulins domain-containing protein n=1 Tax=Steinernema carpocapsae TaxID=34508 RepID=A0A4U5NIJ6_STECR|nr:hypothetical protein L596_016262 [Steinernema carpocapsae]